MRSSRRFLATLAGIAVVVVACSSGAPGSPALTASPAPSTVAPTAGVSAASSAEPSPRGPVGHGQIVYEDWIIRASRHQLYVDSLDGSGPRPLAPSSFDDARPALSPDGTHVLFVRIGDGYDKLMLANVDGSGARNLGEGPCGDPCNGAEYPEWSPNGKQVVFKRAFFEGDAFLKLGIVIVDLESGALTEVTMNVPGNDGLRYEDNVPDWSPDGKRIAFERIDLSTQEERAAIFTIGIDGKDLHQVTPWDLGANEPNWSPDGARIAFNVPAKTFQGGEQNIYTIRPDGTDMVQVTEHLSMGEDNPKNEQATFDPVWSPDGSQLLFTHFPSTDGLADLFVVNVDGSGLHALAETRSLNESHATWSIDAAG